MISYELFHFIETVLLVPVGVFGGIYAFRTLKFLYGNPELLKSQRIIWMPILVAGGLFSVSSGFHLGEHIFSITEMNLLSEWFMLAGLSVLALGIFRYWRFWQEYSETKHGALRKLKSS